VEVVFIQIALSLLSRRVLTGAATVPTPRSGGGMVLVRVWKRDHRGSGGGQTLSLVAQHHTRP
jgi:hypothetical protein